MLVKKKYNSITQYIKQSLKTELNQKILAKTADRHQRLSGPYSRHECTFVSRSFGWVFGSVFSVVFIHFSHCGELWFTLIQPVVWTLLKGNQEYISAWKEIPRHSVHHTVLKFKTVFNLNSSTNYCNQENNTTKGNRQDLDI